MFSFNPITMNAFSFCYTLESHYISQTHKNIYENDSSVGNEPTTYSAEGLLPTEL